MYVLVSYSLFFMCMPVTFITVKECYVHGIGQDYSSWTLYLTLQITRWFLLYTLSCTLLDKISWFLKPWPRTSDFIVFHKSASKPKQQKQPVIYISSSILALCLQIWESKYNSLKKSIPNTALILKNYC